MTYEGPLKETGQEKPLTEEEVKARFELKDFETIRARLRRFDWEPRKEVVELGSGQVEIAPRERETEDLTEFMVRFIGGRYSELTEGLAEDDLYGRLATVLVAGGVETYDEDEFREKRDLLADRIKSVVAGMRVEEGKMPCFVRDLSGRLGTEKTVVGAVLSAYQRPSEEAPVGIEEGQVRNAVVEALLEDLAEKMKEGISFKAAFSEVTRDMPSGVKQALGRFLTEFDRVEVGKKVEEAPVEEEEPIDKETFLAVQVAERLMEEAGVKPTPEKLGQLILDGLASREEPIKEPEKVAAPKEEVKEEDKEARRKRRLAEAPPPTVGEEVAPPEPEEEGEMGITDFMKEALRE